MLKRTVIGCLAILLAGLARPAQADLNISIGSTSIAEGGTGTIDVYISSTTGTDQINDYGLTLVIQGSNLDNSQLQFSTSPDFGFATTDRSSPPQLRFLSQQRGHRRRPFDFELVAGVGLSGLHPVRHLWQCP